MPILARQWVQAPGREIEIAYDTLNALAGGIGEVVGVGVFAGVWAFVASRAILKYRLLPAWSGWMGIAAGISVMAPIVELLGVDIAGFNHYHHLSDSHLVAGFGGRTLDQKE
jgi:hypothetical protein